VLVFDEKPSGEFTDFEITFDGWEFFHGR